MSTGERAVVRARESGFRPDIQGMRAIAVMLVVLNHAGVPGLPGGYVGVDVFFVISGFLITGLLIHEADRTGRVSIPGFYMRRARRILPAAMLTLVAIDIAAYVLMNFVRAKETFNASVWTAFFAANFHFAHLATNYFDRAQPPSPFLHYWSLAVEEQFYLVWPALIALVVLVALRLRRSPTTTLAVVAAGMTIASLAWSIHDTKVDPYGAYFSPFVRGWELGLGALLALATGQLSRIPRTVRAVAGWVGCGLIAYAAVTFNTTTPFPGSEALVPTVGVGLLIIAGVASLPAWAPAKFISTPPVTWVGDRSYAIYLWHWPFLVFGAVYAGHTLSVEENLMLIALAIAISALSYALVENPLRHRRWSARTAAIVWPSTIAAALVLAVGLTQLVQPAVAGAIATPQLTFAPARAAAPPSLPAVKAAVAAAKRAAPIPQPLTPALDQLLNDHYAVPPGCDANDGQTTEKICPLGVKTASKTIVAFGDSHLEEWLPAILSMATKDGWKVIPLIKQGCTPPRWVRAYGKAECLTWYRWATRKANRLHPDVAIIGGSIEAGLRSGPQVRADDLAAITKLARNLGKTAKSVMVIGDPSSTSGEPVDCLAAGNANMKRCTHKRSADQAKIYTQMKAAAKAAHASWIETVGWFCYQGLCPMVVGHTVTYLDHSHITQTYANQLTTVFRRAFRGALFG
jgi:peptidoglycan/LPS O-acetylase OafA/YrhL